MGCGCKKNKKKVVPTTPGGDAAPAFPTDEQREDKDYQKRVTEALRQYLEIKRSKQNLNRIR